MAEVSEVSLDIAQGSRDELKRVTVEWRLTFGPQDAGKRFRLLVMLLGEDMPGDDEPPASQGRAASQWLYTFTRADGTRHRIVEAVEGTAVYRESRELDRSVLDEDPGFDLIRREPGDWVRFPHKDEVYARVTLVEEPCQARSETVELVF
ncbi:hypothetical protein JW921_07760 [Candidatus Fermentibacterales bacterium]|nr:hypothetical protein [Candidatus Fermentibacterales bacterium]